MVQKIRLILIIFLISCSSSNKNESGAIDIFYLFDVSKPHLVHMSHATNLSEAIYNEFLESTFPIWPQQHMISTIDRFGLKQKAPCSDYLDNSGPSFGPDANKKKVTPFISDCIPGILNHSGSNRTDIWGAVYYAVNAMDNDKFGKALIIFSDFEPHPDDTLAKTGKMKEIKQQVNLNGISVILIFSESNTKTKGTMKENVSTMKAEFLSKGAFEVKIINLTSIPNNVSSLEGGAKNIFNHLIQSFRSQ